MFLFQTERLPPELLAASTSRNLARGQYLYHQGEAAQAVFTVLSGRVQLCTTTIDGKQVPLYIVRAGECVAEAAVYADNYCSDVVAETKSRVRAFPKDVLQKMLFNHPQLAAESMMLQAKRCNTLRISLELRSLRSARERILLYLKVLALPQTKTVILDRPLKNIADDLGLTRESFYRTLNGLIDEGSVSRTGKVMRLNTLLPVGQGSVDDNGNNTPLANGKSHIANRLPVT
ncbi:MAG: Crp/Fnr family transcriptional regulator [Acidobacteriota bacterium]|nr:Crp/Fnr family transcriptional regulator [Acidobacteriota bacterium]